MTFEEIAKQMVELQNKKNLDYGDAYYSNLDDEGLAAARIAIGNKWRRFKHLSISDVAQQVDEKIEDTLVDLAAYALMTVKWLKNN